MQNNINKQILISKIEKEYLSEILGIYNEHTTQLNDDLKVTLSQEELNSCIPPKQEVSKKDYLKAMGAIFNK